MSHYIKKPKVEIIMLRGAKGEQGGAAWGTITGNLSDQVDLMNALSHVQVSWGDIQGVISDQDDLTTYITQTVDATPITNAEIDAICV